MAETLQRVGYDCTVATSGPEGSRLIDQDTFDVVITDLVMNEVDGEEILRRSKEALPDCEVIVVTGHGSVPKAVEAMQQGAFNFLEKPLTPERLRAVTQKAADAVRLKLANVDLQQRLDERFGFEGIIYASQQMRVVIDRLKRLAPTDASVLIAGETGTGKELVAQALHQNSPRKKKPFVALNCAALSEHLLESELFGHVRGAYTDAQTDRMGRFEYAHGGTLFLDEVGDMPMPTQIKLLRVLESGEIVRVGENKPVNVNVRVLSATNRDLSQAIESGSFRRDLYHRLKVVTIDLPALRQRRDDIIPLADHFRKQFVKRHKKSVRGISAAVSRCLFAADWPGNVRQLRNVIESMVVIDVDEILDLDDLPPELSDVSAATDGETPNQVAGLIGQPLSEIERWAIEQTLQLTGGNREESARILGIGARTLYRKLKEYGLQ
jgi:two-component system response regulator HydG